MITYSGFFVTLLASLILTLFLVLVFGTIVVVVKIFRLFLVNLDKEIRKCKD